MTALDEVPQPKYVQKVAHSVEAIRVFFESQAVKDLYYEKEMVAITEVAKAVSGDLLVDPSLTRRGVIEACVDLARMVREFDKLQASGVSNNAYDDDPQSQWQDNSRTHKALSKKLGGLYKNLIDALADYKTPPMGYIYTGAALAPVAAYALALQQSPNIRDVVSPSAHLAICAALVALFCQAVYSLRKESLVAPTVEVCDILGDTDNHFKLQQRIRQ